MRWFKRSTDSPKLLSLSPLRHSELGNAYSGGGEAPEGPQEGSIADSGDAAEQSIPGPGLPGPLMDLFAPSACSTSSSGSASYTASCSSPSATSSPSTSTTFSYTSDSSSLCTSIRASGKPAATVAVANGGGCGGVNGSTLRKSRIDLSPVNWTKKSSINCYNIEEGRVIERPKGRYISPIRIKNKQQALAQGIIGSGGASTPVCRRILQRDKGLVDGGCSTVDGSLAKNLSKSIGNISASLGDKSPSLSHRSIVYRDKEKKNPLGSTRLSCYQTINFESSENVTKSQLYKSVDDLIFLNGSTTTDDCERDFSVVETQ